MDGYKKFLVAMGVVVLVGLCAGAAAAAAGSFTWSSARPVDPNETLDSVSCPAATQCTAVDHIGQEVTFDPTTGSVSSGGPVVIDAGNASDAVSCPSTTQCTMTSGGGHEETFNPQTGSLNGAGKVTIDTTGAYAVACPSTTQCTLFDFHGNEITFDPTTGLPNAAGTKSIAPQTGFSLACVSTTQCTGGDGNGNEETFNPQSGTVNGVGVNSIDSAANGGLQALSCPPLTLTQCTAVDFHGNEITFDPTTGAHSTVAIDGTNGLDGVSCPSATQCTAIDDIEQEITFNPGSPAGASAVAISGANALDSISCFADDECATVDDMGQEFTGTVPPTIAIAAPAAGSTVTTTPVTVSGTASADSGVASVSVNGVAATVSGSTWTASVPLTFGQNTITATATSNHGGSSQSSETVTYLVMTIPSLTVGAPSVLSSTSATFSALIDPNGLGTSVSFEYGPALPASGVGGALRGRAAARFTYSSVTAAQVLPGDFADHAVSATVTGLLPNTPYHVRVVASNGAGTVTGADQTLTTRADPPPAPPVLGKTFNISPVSGIVLVKIGGQFVPLTEVEQIRNGTVIDALQGSLKLITSSAGGLFGARDAVAHRKRAPRTQTGTFGGAVFKLTQTGHGANKGLTTLSLLDGAVPGAPTYASCTTHRAGDTTGPGAHTAKLSSKVLQTLRASGHGKFRTRGRYGAATVLGTVWTTTDQCNGTLIHAIKDSVSVQNLVTHKTITLHAGHTYLAKAPTHK